MKVSAVLPKTDSGCTYDEDGDEGNLSVHSWHVRGAGEELSGVVWVGNLISLVESNGDTNDGNEELADQHAEGTPDEQWTTTKLLNSVERDWSRAHVDQREDQGDQEGVGDGTSG